MTARRPRPTVRVALAAVAVLVVAGGLTSASAEPGSGPLATGADAATGVAEPLVQRPHPGLPPISAAGQDGTALLNGTASVAKAKTTITLPLQVQRAYAQDTFEYLPKGCNAGEGECKQYNAYSPVWAITNPGPNPSFGVLTDTHVTVLGFGALPVTATLHLSQLVKSDSLIEPLQVTTFGFTTGVKNTTEITGRLKVRLSDVAIDGVPLDVGPDCTTVSPATLDLKGKFTDYGPIDPVSGKPTVKKGEYSVFFGGIVSGDVVIPAFTGCGTASQDLDPLFTGTVSGSGNTLTLNQSYLGTYDTGQPQDCSITTVDGVTPCVAPSKVPLPKK